MILTVQDILPILLKQGTLAAGEQGLDRKVEYFDVLEQPDIKPWLRPHVLMVTTGYAVRNDCVALLNLIQTLQEAEAAGLAIKTRFFDVFPDAAVQYCKDAGLPLILLNDDTSFSEITYPLMETIISAKNDVNLTSRFQTEEEARERHVNLLTDLLVNKNYDWQEMDYRINSLRWPHSPFQMVAIQLKENEATKLLKEDMMEQLHNSTRRYISTKKLRFVAIPMNNECICIFSEMEDGEGPERIFEILQKRLEQMLKTVVVIGISAIHEDYHTIPEAYLDVQDALRIASVLRNNAVVSIQQERYEQIYLRMSREPFWKNTVKERLARLEQYDCNKDMSLIETVEMLIKHMGNRKGAAQELFLHRNTMSYRIKKIESITGMSLSESEDLIQLAIALRIRKYI